MKNYNMRQRLLAFFLVLTMACSLLFQLPVVAETTIEQREDLTIEVNVPDSTYLKKGIPVISAVKFVVKCW